MEQKGLIERVGVKGDARLKKIVLTEKAIELHKNICREIADREKRLKNGILPEDLKVFFKVMNSMSNNMEDNND